MKRIASLALLLLTLPACCKTICGHKPVVVTNEDNGRWVWNLANDETVKIKLRVYPPYKWEKKEMMAFPDDSKYGLAHERMNDPNSVPGDPHYDVFWVTVNKAETNRGCTVRLKLVDESGKEVKEWKVHLSTK